MALQIEDVSYVPEVDGLQVVGKNVMVGLQEVLDVVNASYLNKNLFPIMVGEEGVLSDKCKVFPAGLAAVEGKEEVKPDIVANIFRVDNLPVGFQIHAPLSFEEGWTHWVCYTKTIAGNKYVKTEVRGVHPLRDYSQEPEEVK